MLCVTGSKDGKTGITKRYFMPDLLELLAEAVVEEIVIKRASVLRKIGAYVICTSRRKILFCMSKESVQMQDRKLLAKILQSDEPVIVPLVYYGGNYDNTGRNRRMDEQVKL